MDSVYETLLNRLLEEVKNEDIKLHLKKRKIADELACITHMITAIVIMMCCLKKLQIQSKYLWMAVISQ